MIWHFYVIIYGNINFQRNLAAIFHNIQSISTKFHFRTRVKEVKMNEERVSVFEDKYGPLTAWIRLC